MNRGVAALLVMVAGIFVLVLGGPFIGGSPAFLLGVAMVVIGVVLFFVTPQGPEL